MEPAGHVLVLDMLLFREVSEFALDLSLRVCIEPENFVSNPSSSLLSENLLHETRTGQVNAEVHQEYQCQIY
jgi:hypothetical protein